MTTQWLLFGRSENDDCDPGDSAYWWPLWVDDGPHGADSAEEMIALTWERLELGGENCWVEIAVVPAGGWTVSNTESRNE